VQYAVVWTAVILSTTGCGSGVPRVPTPLGFDTVQVNLPSCSTPLPPVRKDGCSPLAIGISIEEKYVCRMLDALKARVEAAPRGWLLLRGGDWSRVRAVSVCRYQEPTGNDSRSGANSNTQPMIVIEAVVADSDASGKVFAELVEGSNEVRTGGTVNWRGK
jgi:hypothetical protein